MDGHEGTVGVVIPAYNAAGVIARAISSVQAQTQGVAAIVVVDDGSTDGTRDVVSAAGGITLLHRDRGGPSCARNAGTATLDTDWIAFLDADDVWHPEKIAAQLSLARRHPKAALIAAGWTRGALPTSPVALGKDIPLPFLVVLSGYFLGPSGVMVRRRAFEAAGGFDPQRDGVEDRDLWTRIAARSEAFMVGSVLWRYTDSPTSFSKQRQRGFEAGLALMASWRHEVERTEGKRVFQTMLAGVLLRYRFYFTRDRNLDGIARCEAELARLPAKDVAFARRRLYLPQMARRLVTKISRTDTYRSEFLPALADFGVPLGALTRAVAPR